MYSHLILDIMDRPLQRIYDHECHKNRPSELYGNYVCVLACKGYQIALSPLENRAFLENVEYTYTS
jgi:hypothetical protein